MCRGSLLTLYSFSFSLCFLLLLSPLHLYSASRLPSHPRTPNIHRNVPKRSMDGQLRQWRRALHEWDPAVMEAKANGTYVEATASSSSAATKMDEDQSAEQSEGEMVDHSEQSSEDGFVMLQKE